MACPAMQQVYPDSRKGEVRVAPGPLEPAQLVVDPAPVAAALAAAPVGPHVKKSQVAKMTLKVGAAFRF